MTIDEVRTRLRRDLEQTYGVDGAAYLMDRPRGGWDTLVTTDELGTNLEKLELKFEKRLHEELRAQTWQFAKLVAGAQGIVVVAIAAIGIVLRFA